MGGEVVSSFDSFRMSLLVNFPDAPSNVRLLCGRVRRAFGSDQTPAFATANPFSGRGVSGATNAGRWRSPIAAAADMPSSTAAGGLFELSEISDFEAVLSPDGLLSVCGFGSLLSGLSFNTPFLVSRLMIYDWFVDLCVN